MHASPPRNILFVCTGNLCRSPLAEGIFVHLIENRGLTPYFRVDSAGTHAGRIDIPPHPLAVDVAAAHGIDISGQRARKFTIEDFASSDRIVLMDLYQLDFLSRICPLDQQRKLAMLTSFAATACDLEVPDPYGGTRADFEQAFRLIEVCVSGLVVQLVNPRVS